MKRTKASKSRVKGVKPNSLTSFLVCVPRRGMGMGMGMGMDGSGDDSSKLFTIIGLGFGRTVFGRFLNLTQMGLNHFHRNGPVEIVVVIG